MNSGFFLSFFYSPLLCISLLPSTCQPPHAFPISPVRSFDACSPLPHHFPTYPPIPAMSPLTCLVYAVTAGYDSDLKIWCRKPQTQENR